jgi:ferritin-like metal-binding protein YciE
MTLESLHDLFVDQLEDLYDAENQLVKALPKMAEAASSSELKAGFQHHLEQTKGHVQRLERVFQRPGTKAKRKTCDAMKGLIEEGEELISAGGESHVLDAGLICAAQKVEHYEMAGYGCVHTWAQQMGMNEAARLLQETLTEEKQTDEKLNRIAEGMVNLQAVGAGSER